MPEGIRSRFELNDRRVFGTEIWYVGRLVQGELRTGDSFQILQRTRASPLPKPGQFRYEILETIRIELLVARIEIFGRDVEVLDQGFSCGLCLAGAELELLRDYEPGHGVSTYDVLLTDRGTHVPIRLP